MNKKMLVTEAKASIDESGRNKVAFVLPKKYYREVQQLSRDLSQEICATHSAILKCGLDLLLKMKQEDAWTCCAKFRKEKEEEPRAPSSFGISSEVHEEIKDIAISLSLKNVEAHYIALTIGLEKFQIRIIG